MTIPFLTLLVWLPFFGFLATLAFGSTQKRARSIALAVSVADTILAVLLTLTFLTQWLDPWLPGAVGLSGTPVQEFRYVERYNWVPSLGISYIMGLDGLSLPLVLLTPLLTTLAIGFSWDKKERPKAFFALLLLMEWSILGVFVTLDFFLFFVFWELVLIPMFFLIGIWGGPNRHYASYKFLIYTHVGSVIMLLGIFAMFLAVTPTLFGPGNETFDMIRILDALSGPGRVILPMALQIPMFIAFFFGFIVKLPSVPFHTWLPDAHVEAPTAGSVILAGLLLKMGGYGIFRVALPMLPEAAADLWWVMAAFGVVSMIYASLVCLRQVDLKKLIAYSSIGHMGFVLLGASSQTTIGIAGAIFQLFNHGIITAALFMLAGTIKHSAGTRDIPKLRGLGQQMPLYSAVLMISFFASLGLPGLNSFVSEFMVFTGTYAGGPYQPYRALVLVPLLAIVITGAYYLWTMQKMVFGTADGALGKLHDLKRNEIVVYSILIAMMFLVGFLPSLWLGILWDPSTFLTPGVIP